MNNNIIKIKYNPNLMIAEIKNLPVLMESEDDNNIGIYKFMLYSEKNGLSMKAMINEVLTETLSPMKDLVEIISREVINAYDLFNMNLDLNKNSHIELFSLHLDFKKEKRFQLLIVLNPDYIEYFNEDKFNENDNLDEYVTNFNEALNKIILKVYELADDLDIPIIKVIKKTDEYELIFKRDENNEWTYYTFVRTLIKPIVEQKKDIQNIIHSVEYHKIKRLLEEVPDSKFLNECFVKLNYDGDNISNVLYNINK